MQLGAGKRFKFRIRLQFAVCSDSFHFLWWYSRFRFYIQDTKCIIDVYEMSGAYKRVGFASDDFLRRVSVESE